MVLDTSSLENTAKAVTCRVIWTAGPKTAKGRLGEIKAARKRLLLETSLWQPSRCQDRLMSGTLQNHDRWRIACNTAAHI